MSRRLEAQRPRVFCIGWHKTGTTTIGLALIKLSYSVLGCRLDMVHPLRRGDVGSVVELAGRFDAVQDVPWAALYQELDQRYPGSRFILTEREPQKWLSSARRHFGSYEIPLHEWLYGQGRMKDNEDLYLKRYLRHNEEVKQYFSTRPHDLLVLNFENGDRWEKLCDFLDIPVPVSAFPHENKSPAKRSLMETMKYRVREWTPDWARATIFDLKLKLRFARGLPDPRNRFHNFRENRVERKSWPRDA